MKKLNLSKRPLLNGERLTREQMKRVMGGDVPTTDVQLCRFKYKYTTSENEPWTSWSEFVPVSDANASCVSWIESQQVTRCAYDCL